MRLFIAFDLPCAFRSQVVNLQQALAKHTSGRWVPGENLHTTIAFLGETNEQGAHLAMNAIDQAATEALGPARLDPTGLGEFSKKGASTLYLDLAPEAGLIDIALDVRRRLAAHHMFDDSKTYIPHVTLARKAEIVSQELYELPFPAPASAENIVLFKSTLTADGPIYKTLYECALPAHEQ